jgi:diguanylate cyclase (GGDEF)-like protein
MAAQRPESWLCHNGAERQRLLDMERRLRPVRAVSLLILGCALLVTGPSLGWWTLAPLVLSAAGFALVDRGLEGSSRPEYRLAAAWLLAESAIAGSVALTGGPRSPAVAWLAIPVVTLSARFSERGVLAGMGYAAGLIALVTLGVDPAYVAHHLSAVVFPLALLGAIGALSTALMRSDLHHRGAAAIDPLTGMLNRNALTTRVGELAQQAVVARHSIGVIIGDIDRFKSINDAHGHAAGDAVLRDIADRLRSSLRAFDLAYRVGGEEFLVILPGASLERAQHVAEQLRASVADHPVAGLLVTMSFGVTASPPGDFDFDGAFVAADIALYEAKHAGRDNVRTRPIGAEPAAHATHHAAQALFKDIVANDPELSRAFADAYRSS